MLVVTSIDNISDEELIMLAHKHSGLSLIKPEHFYDFNKNTIFDYPPEGCRPPKELLSKVSDNLLCKPIYYNFIEDDFMGHYWDVKALDLNFTYTIMHWEKYMDENGDYHIPTHVTSALIVFNFDSKADAMLAKLGIEELRSISVEDYRRLLGEIGQPSVHLPI
ncbi:hypothetical protein D3C87_482350 [compost metagenome]